MKEQGMKDIEERNAVIESVTLGNDDHGGMSAWLRLNYGGSGQGFGGYCLYLPKSCKHHNLLSPAGHFIHRCIEVGGVDAWEDLPGRTIRVRCTHDNVQAIGHIVKDDWFEPAVDFEALNKARISS